MILQDIPYRLAHAAAIKPAGPAPIIKRSICDAVVETILKFQVRQKSAKLGENGLWTC